MTTKEFEEIVNKHSACPGNELYNSNAMCGEAGEVANNVKKIHIFREVPECIADEKLNINVFSNQKLDELGDLLFYVVRNILDEGKTVEQIMVMQATKLKEQSNFYGRIFRK